MPARSLLPVVYSFLLLARFWEVRPPALGYAAALPALVLAGLMLGTFGLALSSLIRQLENFAGVMNFVIFPAFFASTALYPLWRLEDVSPSLAGLPGLIHSRMRSSLFASRSTCARALEAAICGLALVVFLLLAVWSYDPGRGFWTRRMAE